MVRAFNNLKVGVNIHTTIQQGVDPVTEALHAEHLGFDVVTFHGDALHGSSPSFELWTLLGWVAAHTSSIRVAPVVLALPHRHPVVLAKMAETLGRLSQGRLILVLGAGGPMNEPAYRALGLASRSPREKVQALEEAVDLLRGLWGTSGFSYAGQHFRTEGATIEPKPGRPLPLWLGVFGDRMLDLVGRKADGWLGTCCLSFAISWRQLLEQEFMIPATLHPNLIAQWALERNLHWNVKEQLITRVKTPMLII